MKMATMQLTKTTLFNLSKAFPRVLSPATASRVCFSSSVSHSEGRDPLENARDDRADSVYGSKKWREDTQENYAQAAKDTTYDAKEKAKTKSKLNEGAYEAQDTKERAKDYAEDTMENAKAKAQDVKEKVKRYGEDTKETVKGKAEELGEKSKETVKETWENTKNAAQTMAEAVVGHEEDVDKARADIDKGGEDLTRKMEKDRKEDEFITFK